MAHEQQGTAEESPFTPSEGSQDYGDGADYIDGPSEHDLAEEFGAAVPLRDEDIVPDDGEALPELAIVKRRISEKTQVLMEELFRAKITRVQRINPKKIR